VLEDFATIEPRLRRGATDEVDTSRPLADVVDEVLELSRR